MLALCLRLLLATAAALLMITAANAGGIVIIPGTVEIGSGQQRQFRPGETIKVSFGLQDYEYGSPEFKYGFFAVVPRAAPLKRVTISDLRRWETYYSLLKAPNRSQGASDTAAPKRLELEFPAPSNSGDYQLVYNRVPAFLQSPVTRDDVLGEMVRFSAGEKPSLTQEALQYADEYAPIVGFSVTREGAPTNPLTVYLRANNVQPAFADIRGGIVDKPLEISWYVGPEFKRDRRKVLFRYKTWPLDENWSAWSHDDSVKYHFLPKGSLSIQVEALYEDGGEKLTSEIARFSFALEQHLVAKPSREAFNKSPEAQLKPFERAGQKVIPNIAFDKVYSRSRALLIGLYQFDDKANFAEFSGEKISNDVKELKAALEINGFETTTLFAPRLTRDQIYTAIENLLAAAGENDRLFIYFSSHGFAEKDNASEAYIATSDCELNRPGVRCVRLSDIEYQAKRALNGPKVRQVLIAVDSCFSGLGIISKAAGPPDISKLAAAPGAYMLTAGMADQEAQIDPELKMSTFTHFLSRGLSGEAKLLDKNGMITLTELFLYVQYNVAKRTGSSQIPMLGRLVGNGEMLFKPHSAPR